MTMTRRSLLGALGAAVLSACGGGKAKPAEGVTREREAYGTTKRQVGDWWVPAGTGPLPTVVLVHGGYWRSNYDLGLEDDLAADLSGRGFLVWNVDYAPSSDPWPATLTDVAAAYDSTFTGRHADRVDKTRVAVVGHSAGGHLALWLASRGRLPEGAPGAGAHVTPALAVPQAPVASFVSARRLGLGSGAVDALLQSDDPTRLAVADPAGLAPSGVRTVLVHGTGDTVVPLSQSEDYLAVAKDCTLVKVPGGHFEHLDPTSQACEALRTALATL